jgi:signal transduction histidine kinase/CheY-like chemotaxis protein
MLELIKELFDAVQCSPDDFYRLLLLKYLELVKRRNGFIISVNHEGKPYLVSISESEESNGDKLHDFYIENYFTVIKDLSKKEPDNSFCIYERNGVLLIGFRCSLKGIMVLADHGPDKNPVESGKLRSFSGLAVKIIDFFNKRLQLENKIIRSREENENKGLYLTSFAHELKTPVNAIAGFAQLLKEPELKHENLKKYISIISDTSEKLISIISYLNEIAEIESGNLKAVDNIVNVPALIEDLFDKFCIKFRKKNIVLEKKIPPEEAYSLVRTDESKVKQVLNTLVLNALNNTFTGSVRIGCRLINESVEFSVVDTGIGMSPEKRARIFNFRALNSSDTKNLEDSGLGLIIAKSYIQLLGGRIWCESQEGSGTKFYFSIPYRPVSGTTGINDLQKEKKADQSVSSKKRILVAEDDNLNFYLINSFLSNLNVEIVRALNGKEAVDIFKSLDVDLILMDIRMPVMDGYKAAQLIRELNPEIKIIVQTAFSNDRSVAIENGCCDFIAKPFNRNQLLSVVSAYL